jgi:hypothetical protein
MPGTVHCLAIRFDGEFLAVGFHNEVAIVRAPMICKFLFIQIVNAINTYLFTSLGGMPFASAACRRERFRYHDCRVVPPHGPCNYLRQLPIWSNQVRVQIITGQE